MPRGRKPEPTKLLLLRGSKYAKSRASEVQPAIAATCPKPPAHVQDDARTFWREVAPALHKIGLLTQIDLHAFEVLSTTWGLYRRCDREVSSLVYTDSDGSDHAHPVWRIKRQFADVWLKIAGEFGMTPRSRVGLQGVMPTPEGEHDDKARFFRRGT